MFSIFKTLRKVAFFAICSAAIFTGCDTLATRKYYRNGTICLKNGDYQEAICNLKQAARLDPSLSCHHQNLAAAYFLSGDIQAAWYYSRQAVRCRPCSPESVVLFHDILGKYCIENNLNFGKKRCYDILGFLGDPDEIHLNDTIATYVYGMTAFEFDRDVFVRTYNW